MLLSDVMRRDLGIDVSVLMGANVANDVCLRASSAHTRTHT